MKGTITASTLVSLLVSVCAVGQPGREYLDTSLDFETRAGRLVEQMTLEEKISQLGNDAPAIERLGIPAYDWWNECLHGVGRAGVATVFPQAIGLAATFDRAMMHDVATVISDEARAKHHEALRHNDHGRYKGLTFWSPNINIFRDPRWGRGQETYGEDPYLTGQMGIQFVRGLQGHDPKYLKLVATAKHYAVHNGPEPERHSFDAIVNARDLWETYLPAFHGLVVTARAYSVMGAFNRVDGESASASWMLLKGILRKQWGFDGYIVSDCGAISDIVNTHKMVDTREQAVALGIRRGCDLNCGRLYQRVLQAAAEQGLVDEAEIDLAVYHLMLARMKLGMFDPPEKVPYAQIPYQVNDSEAHDQMALAMARKSMTLLKNDGLLPLNKARIKTIAVIGPNADSLVALRGNYNGDASHPVTILEGIRKAAGEDIEILYSAGCPHVPNMPRGRNSPPANTGTSSSRFQVPEETLEAVKNADVAIFVGGLTAELEGEEMPMRIDGFAGGDRTRIELPEVQMTTLKAMQTTGTPVVFVLLSGSAVAMNWADDAIPAILAAWYPGQRGGDAVADVLFGDANPAGRLPVTFYASTDELADFRNYNMRAGKGQTYRYYYGEPAYPFGHGLSYTTFVYSDMAMSRNSLRADDTITVSVNVTNTGDRDGEEVVQLYVRDVESSLPMPVMQLRGFERIALAKGKSKTVTFTLKPIEDMRYYNAMLQAYAVEPGEFEIQIGASSRDIRLKDTVTVVP